MDDRSLMKTSESLMYRLRVEVVDPADWAEFVNRYAPLILSWCRRWNLQEADAEDVTQNVLIKLVAKLRTSRYNPSQSFRAYIKTLAHYALCDFVKLRQRSGPGGTGDTAVLQQLDNVAACDDLENQLADAFDQELLAEAMARVRQRVESRTWEAFRLTALEGLMGTEAASRVGMQVAATFKAKSKVHKMIREEVSRLQQGLMVQ